MGSYQILGRSAKVQNAYNIRILRPARQPVFFFFFTVATFFNKKNCSAYNDDRRRMQCLFLKEQV